MDKESPILVRVFKEESELEVWKQDRTGRFALLKTYPICRWSGELGPKIKEGDRQAPEGFYTITPGQMNPNSQYLSVVRSRLSERLRPRARPHRRAPDGARRLLVARLLLDDRRADLGNLRARPRGVLRRPALVPGAGLSVPHDAGEYRQASQQPAHGVLEDAQARQRPFRGHQARAEGRTSARSATCSTPKTRTIRCGRCRSAPPASARCSRWPDEVVAAVQGQAAHATSIRIAAARPAAARRSRRSRTGADGGMHPVFVAAVKRNEVGVVAEHLRLFDRFDPGHHPGDRAAAAHPRTCRLAAGDRQSDRAAGRRLALDLERAADDGGGRRHVRAGARRLDRADGAGEHARGIQVATSSAACSRPSRSPRDKKNEPSVMDRMATHDRPEQGRREGAAAARRRGAEAEGRGCACSSEAGPPATPSLRRPPAPGAIRPKPADEPKTAAQPAPRRACAAGTGRRHNAPAPRRSFRPATSTTAGRRSARSRSIPTRIVNPEIGRTASCAGHFRG